MKNSKTTRLLAIASLLPVSALIAEPFSWELGLDYITGDTDVDDIQLNEDNLSFTGTYFFEPLDSVTRSLHEAPFTQRASYLTFGVDVEQLDDDIDNVIDTETISLNGQFTNRETGWYLGLGYINADADFDQFALNTPSMGFNPEYDGYAAEVGKYVAETTTVYLGYTQLDYKNSFMPDSQTDNIGVGMRHFGSITENVDYSFEANYYFVDLQVADFDDLDDDPFDDSGEVASVTATIYPNRSLGIGLTYADSDDLMGAPYLTSTSEVQDGIGVFADWFVTENVSLRALYNNSVYDVANLDNLDDPGDVEEDSLLFGVKTRF